MQEFVRHGRATRRGRAPSPIGMPAAALAAEIRVARLVLSHLQGGTSGCALFATPPQKGLDRIGCRVYAPLPFP